MKALRLAAILLAASPMVSSFESAAQVDQLNADINVIPDKSVKTDEGVRITLCLVGIPNTSQRIDGIDLNIGQKLVKATDIDGIDFERYFQFEETGVMTVDVDFPFSGTLPKTATVTLHTVNGDIVAPARQ